MGGPCPIQVHSGNIIVGFLDVVLDLMAISGLGHGGRAGFDYNRSRDQKYTVVYGMNAEQDVYTYYRGAVN